MAVVLVVLQPFSLFSQPSVCPEYSICLEADPDDCNQLSVSINGLVGDSIGGLTFRIDVPPGLNINVSATESSFESTSIGNNFIPFTSGALDVTSDYVFVRFFSFSGIPPYVPTEECVHIGNIVFDTIEVDCIDFDTVGVVFTPTFDGPLHLGPEVFNLLSCDQFTFDCPCSTECPEDWSYALFPHPNDCGRVQVFILNALGYELSGFQFTINLEHGIVIDSSETHSAFFHSDIGRHSWDSDEVIINSNILTLRTLNLFGSPYTIPSNSEYLFDIVFERQSCVSFEDSIVSLGNQSELFIGHPLSEIEFCANIELGSSGFTVCCEDVLLAGNIKRPTSDGPECVEGISWGFPYGEVKVEGLTIAFDTTLITDEAGYYEVVVPSDETYRITPDYTDEFSEFCTHGVSVVDLAHINQVILGQIPCFFKDYAPVAADLNFDKQIDSLDRLQLIDWILDISYPPSGNWQFMPQVQYDDKFLDAPCPAQQVENYDEFRDVAAGFYDETALNFAAIKMGDLDTAYFCTECLEDNSFTGGGLAGLKVISNQSGEFEVYLKNPEDYRSIEALFFRIESDYDIHPGIISEKSLLYHYGDLDRDIVLDNGIAIGWHSFGDPLSGLTISEKPLMVFELSNLEEIVDFELVVGEMLTDGKLTHLYLESEGFERSGVLDKLSVDSDWVYVYPNPGGNHLKIGFLDVPDEEIRIQFWDIQGRMWMEEVFAENGTQERVIHTGQLPSGVYTIRLTTANRLETVKWIKQ